MAAINRRVSLLFRMGERYVNRELTGRVVTSGTAPLLLELRDGGPRQVTALAQAIGVDKAHVARSIRPLEEAGLVEVAPVPGGGRRLLVSLTDAGLREVAYAERVMLDWLAVVGRGIDPGELRVVDGVFDRFFANAQDYFASSAAIPSRTSSSPGANSRAKE